MSKIQAPFNDAQVEALNAWQRWGAHPFACPNHPQTKLTAEKDGLHCAEEGRGLVQDWAYAFVLSAKYCLAEHPCPADSKLSEYWIHPAAYEANPRPEGSLVPFHCPHCNRDVIAAP